MVWLQFPDLACSVFASYIDRHFSSIFDLLLRYRFHVVAWSVNSLPLTYAGTL